MAWYEITYKCGHSGREQIYGPTKLRQGRADWIGEHKVCPECFAEQCEREREERQAEYARQSAAAAIAANEANLPELTGSPKQIAWSESLRRRMLDQLDAQFAALLIESESLSEEEHRIAGIFRDEFSPWLRGQTAAKWWIDHREQSLDQMRIARDAPAMLGMAMSGRGAPMTIDVLWSDWFRSAHPEIIAEREAKAAAEAAERQRRDNEALAAALAPLEQIDETHYTTAMSDEPMVIDGHKITVHLVGGTRIEIGEIDGSRRIDLPSGDTRWVESTDQAEAAAARLQVVFDRLRAETEAKAATFRVGNRPDDVTFTPGHPPYPERGGSFTVRATDGRTAEGWNMDGEWVAHTIISPSGEHKLDACSPEAERIGREAYQRYQQQQQQQQQEVRS
jgi:hypothetical protein